MLYLNHEKGSVIKVAVPIEPIQNVVFKFVM